MLAIVAVGVLPYAGRRAIVKALTLPDRIGNQLFRLLAANT